MEEVLNGLKIISSPFIEILLGVIITAATLILLYLIIKIIHKKITRK